ncbi:MAG: hypothetical protein CK424_07945 [Legionella sp.]|nr:MAG: hypothetical protein CK424_07945 [Legionella sp.]
MSEFNQQHSEHANTSTQSAASDAINTEHPISPPSPLEIANSARSKLLDRFSLKELLEEHYEKKHLNDFDIILEKMRTSRHPEEIDACARKLYLFFIKNCLTFDNISSKDMLILATQFFDVINDLNNDDAYFILNTYKQLAELYMADQDLLQAKKILTLAFSFYKRIIELSVIHQDGIVILEKTIQSMLSLLHFLPNGALDTYPVVDPSHINRLNDNPKTQLHYKLYTYPFNFWTLDQTLNDKDTSGNTPLFYAALSSEKNIEHIASFENTYFYKQLPPNIQKDHCISANKGHILRLWLNAKSAYNNSNFAEALKYAQKLHDFLIQNISNNLDLGTYAGFYFHLYSCFILASLSPNDTKYLKEFFHLYSLLEHHNIHNRIDPYNILLDRAKKLYLYGYQEQESMTFSTQGRELAKQYGFDCVETEGGGACFFHAVIYQLIRQKHPAALINNQLYHTAFTLRHIAIKHITQHPDYYKLSLDNHDVLQYIDQAKKPEYWADHQLILALSRALNISIVILSTKQPDPIIIKPTTSTTIIFLVNHDNMHFESLVKNQEHKHITSIETLINKASSDGFQNIPNKAFQIQDLLSQSSSNNQPIKKKCVSFSVFSDRSNSSASDSPRSVSSNEEESLHKKPRR